MFTNKMMFDDGNFKVCWAYDEPTDMVHFKLDVNATGWVSFGITTTPREMNNYDVAVGWVNGGKGYIQVMIPIFRLSLVLKLLQFAIFRLIATD